MGSKFIVVAGDGETTRNNVEALVADFFYDKPKDYLLLLPVINRPSQGQVWAHQIFQEMGMSTAVIAPSENVVFNLGGSSLTENENPLAEALRTVEGEEAYVFALIDEEHGIDLSGFTEAQVPCYNLCRGLMAVNAVKPVQKASVAQPKAVVTPEKSMSELNASLVKLVADFNKSLQELLKEHGINEN